MQRNRQDSILSMAMTELATLGDEQGGYAKRSLIGRRAARRMSEEQQTAVREHSERNLEEIRDEIEKQAEEATTPQEDNCTRKRRIQRKITFPQLRKEKKAALASVPQHPVQSLRPRLRMLNRQKMAPSPAPCLPPPSTPTSDLSASIDEKIPPRSRDLCISSPSKVHAGFPS